MTVNGERALRPSSAMSALTPKADPDRRIPAPGAAWLLYAKGPCNHNARSQWRAARRELDDSRRVATLARAAVCGVEGHLRYAAFVDASGRKGQVGEALPMKTVTNCQKFSVVAKGKAVVTNIRLLRRCCNILYLLL